MPANLPTHGAACARPRGCACRPTRDCPAAPHAPHPSRHPVRPTARPLPPLRISEPPKPDAPRLRPHRAAQRPSAPAPKPRRPARSVAWLPQNRRSPAQGRWTALPRPRPFGAKAPSPANPAAWPETPRSPPAVRLHHPRASDPIPPDPPQRRRYLPRQHQRRANLPRVTGVTPRAAHPRQDSPARAGQGQPKAEGSGQFSYPQTARATARSQPGAR